MVTLQDIDVALARAVQLMPQIGRSPAQDEQLTCLTNAREMLIDLGQEASASLARMTDTLERLGDITESM